MTMRQLSLALIFTLSAPLTGNSQTTLRQPDKKATFDPGLSEIEMSFPVNWDMMKSGFGGQGVASTSESYSEYWTFIQHADHRSFLVSPRAKVPVLGFQRRDPISSMPDKLLIQEDDMAKLLGLKIRSDASLLPQVFFVTLSTRNDQPDQFTLQTTQNELTSITLSLHN
jgi:hypothetical protein